VLKKKALSGIKPIGELHIGNYLGMINSAFDLAKTYQALYFIADYHALTTVKDRKSLKREYNYRNELCEKRSKGYEVSKRKRQYGNG
jgi:tryptophanyl-tRNA synthetase